jgi:hypothetical protein
LKRATIKSLTDFAFAERLFEVLASRMIFLTCERREDSSKDPRPISLVALLAIILLCFALDGGAAVTVYPSPRGVAGSANYRVEVLDGEKFVPLFVNRSAAQKPDSNSHPEAAFASFAFTEKVTVRVTKMYGPVPTKVVVLPSSRQITAKLSNRSATFELTKPGQFSVEFDNDLRVPMLIFADPPETNVPDRNAPGVKWFDAGVHVLPNGELKLGADETAYLAPGAVVYGRILGQGKNIRILGRGILSGERIRWASNPDRQKLHLCIFERPSHDLVVDGPTFINSPAYNLSIKGLRARVSNVKMIGWWFNTDGVQAWGDSVVEDCFLMCNDDSLKLYMSGMSVKRCTIWQLENGAPFQISWNMPNDNSGFTISDCDVIRTEHRWKNQNTAVFCAIHGGNGKMSNYVFDDIRIENVPFRVWNVTIQTNEFAKGQIPGNISGLTFRNIKIGQATQMPNTFKGLNASSTISGVTFENIILPGGKRMTNPQEAKIEWDAATVKNVSVR